MLHLIALFNPKIKSGVDGRRECFKTLITSLDPDKKALWFHCSSLGEYEQGLPVFEALIEDYPNHNVVLSFFSPSGYEIKKNVSWADAVVYLPLDTQTNVNRFLNHINAEIIVFVKYEIWPNYLYEIKRRGIKSILISALFNPSQIYFKPYGKFMLKALKSFDQIFVQNDASLNLLNTYGIQQVTLSGDTRFDRVSKQLEMENDLDFIEVFKADQLCLVAGSTWPEDEALLAQYINTDPATKYIIAPHNINEKQINALITRLQKPFVLHSKKAGKNLRDYQVYIVDTIGLLSKIYSYADLAYVGGAVGKTGLHNTLEPAVFGIPIIIGSHYHKFPEAITMINNGGMFSFSSQNELHTVLTSLIDNANYRTESGNKNALYIQKNRGAVIQIINYLRI